MNWTNPFPLEARALLYATLAASLRSEPSAALLSELRDRVSPIRGRMSEWPQPALEQSIDALLKALASATPEVLSVDYADLFLVGKNGSPFPSESAYLEKMVYGQATVDVIESYAQCGFVREDSFREPYDHIALECAFMAALGMELLERASGSNRGELKRLIDAQSSFIELHMGRWVPGWAEKLKAAAGTKFYKAVAGLASSLLGADRNLLTSLSGEIKSKGAYRRKAPENPVGAGNNSRQSKKEG